MTNARQKGYKFRRLPKLFPFFFIIAENRPNGPEGRLLILPPEMSAPQSYSCA